MTTDEILWYLQFLVITVAAIICISKAWNIGIDNSEKKYIARYCIINAIVMLLLFIENNYFTNPILYIIISASFAGIEIVFIPFYILDIIGEKKNLTTPLLIFFLAEIISILIFKNYISFTFLATNLYIALHVFKYIIWLFKTKKIKGLNKSSHFVIIQGIAICYIGSIPFFFGSLISKLATEKEYYLLFEEFEILVYSILNICMYILIIKAFLCNIPSRSSNGQLEVH